MNAYRLLRDNKEIGPFTAEELVKMGLKAYDLVWVDGKSAAWRYPSELPEFQSFAPAVEEQPYDRFYKKEKEVEKPAKPRFRIRPDWRKLDKSAAAEVPSTPVQAREVIAAPVAFEPARSANPVNNTGMAPPATTGTAPQPPRMTQRAATPATPVSESDTTPEIKYSESLDSIKERYQRTILERRHAFSERKPWQYALLLVPVLIMGIVIGSRWDKGETNKETEKKDAIVTEQPATSMAQALTTPSESGAEEKTQKDPMPMANTAPAADTATQPATHPVVAASHVTVPKQQITPVKTIASTGKTTGTAVKQPAMTATAKTAGIPVKQPVTVAPGKADMAKTTKTPVMVKTTTPPQSAPIITQAVVRTTAPTEKQAAAANTSAPRYEAPAASGKNRIADYVSVKDEYAQEDGDRHMKLHVQNKSNIPVDLVVLDLQYYDSNGRFRKGETLYVNNLSANDEVALSAPAVKNAPRIDYKVSLLSIEKKGIYLIAE